MKILFFIESLRLGGKERRLVELIKGLNQLNAYKILLVLGKDLIEYSDICNLNIKIQIIERTLIKKDPRLFYKFLFIARKFKPDIIHVWGNMVAIYAIPTKIILNTKMINNQITNSFPKGGNKFLNHKITFFFSDHIVSNSVAGLEAYDAPLNRSGVIYNGFDFNRLAHLKGKEELRNNYGISGKFVIGMVATFYKQKDYSTFLKAAQFICKTRKDIDFLCIGSGNFDYLKDYIDDNTEGRIHFIEKRTGIESLMNICDVGVLLTNPKFHAEGISNAILEFMALSKPVIANDTGGTNELIIDGITGYLIDSYDFVELSNKIVLLLQDQSLRSRIGSSSRKRIENRFSIKRMVDEFVQLYHQTTSFKL